MNITLINFHLIIIYKLLKFNFLNICYIIIVNIFTKKTNFSNN